MFQCCSKGLPESYQSHSRVIPELFQSHSRVIPQSFQSHSRVIPESFQSHSKKNQPNKVWQPYSLPHPDLYILFKRLIIDHLSRYVLLFVHANQVSSISDWNLHNILIKQAFYLFSPPFFPFFKNPLVSKSDCCLCIG